MRIKSDVEFVKRECESNDTVEWCDIIWYYYTPACLTEDVILEKGKKYTINDGINVFDFVEESENFVIFKDGYAIEKEGNTFTECDPKPEFLKKDWRVERRNDDFVVYCGLFGVCTIGESGLYPNKNISPQLGLPLDENGAVKIKNS